MATPLNVFKTVTYELTVTDDIIYTAPVGFTGIVLMAQIANITSNPVATTFSHYRTTGAIRTELIKDFNVAANDAANAITGKLILEVGDSIIASASANSSLKITLSILESLNAN